MNPCSCNLDTCRLCWLAKNDQRYQKLWANRKGPTAKSAPAKPTAGPGTELSKLLAELGLKITSSCACKKRAREMDSWGVAGCNEHREEIVAWLRFARGQASWLETIRAATAAVTRGLVIDPFDVESSLLAIALARAEKSDA